MNPLDQALGAINRSNVNKSLYSAEKSRKFTKNAKVERRIDEGAEDEVPGWGSRSNMSNNNRSRSPSRNNSYQRPVEYMV